MRIHYADVYGFCKGVEHVVDLAEKLLAEHPDEKCYSIGAIVHNKTMVDSFQERGLEVLSSPEGAEKGYALIRAHGITPETEKRFSDAGFTLIDGTCRLVARNHAIAEESTIPVVIIGKKGHAEVVSTAGHAKQPCFIVEELSDLGQLDIGTKYTVIVQTTFSSANLELIKNEMTRRGISAFFANNICAASTRRREALKKLCTICDTVIVVGDRHSANSMELYDLAVASGVRAYIISGPEEVTPEMANCENLGFTAGASVPFSIIKKVRGRIESYASTQQYPNTDN